MRERWRRWRAPRRRHFTAGMLRERRRRRLRLLSTVLVLSGALLLADVAATVLWREPVTAYLASRSRDRQDDELARQAGALRADGVRAALRALRDDRARLRFLARRARREAERGEAVGRIRVPRLDLDDPVVYGTGDAELREGPAMYPDQPLPGLPGTVGVAGHRTTYGAPFRHLDRLERGDRVTLRMPYGRFDYRVRSSRIVDPDDLWVLDRRAEDQVVLSACHPLFSAARRIVVTAVLERVVADLDGRRIEIDPSRAGVGQPASGPQGLRTGPPMR